MGDIVIRSAMKMPKTCGECKLRDGKDRCPFELSLAGLDIQKERLDSCPLEDIGEHGDLIDRSRVVLDYSFLMFKPPENAEETAEGFAEQIRMMPVALAQSQPDKSWYAPRKRE